MDLMWAGIDHFPAGGIDFKVPSDLKPAEFGNSRHAGGRS
jgi:hypothetical protein